MSNQVELTKFENLLMSNILEALSNEGVDTCKVAEVIIAEMAVILAQEKEASGFIMNTDGVSINVSITTKPEVIH